MKIILISQDDKLAELCREVLMELGGTKWDLSVANASDGLPEADLYIWDDQSRTAPPPELDQTWSRHLFLVERSDAPNCCGKPGVPAAVLLKPVTRTSLAAFFGLAAAVAEERSIAECSLRAERDEMLQCLIQSNLQIQKFDQDRTNFLARAVHDFRAPLMTANGYCGLLLSEELGPENEDQKEVLRRMQHSIKRLSRMASAMFELSVGRHLKREPGLRRIDLRECVERALQETAPLADAKRITISVDIETGPVVLFADSGQIEQMLVHLLENACKFTPKAGEIAIRAYPFFWERRVQTATTPAAERRLYRSAEPNAYRVDIQDTGPRIPREYLAKIFEEHTSYTGGADRSGGGLGLAICKMIVAAHEGRVWAENLDFATRFSFVLPARMGVDSATEGGRAFVCQAVADNNHRGH